MRSFLRRFKTWIILGVIVLAGGTYYVYQDQSGEEADHEVFKVERVTLDRSIEATGTLEPTDTISLSFNASGIVSSVNVHVGDSVAAGQSLAQLSNADEAARVAEASANLSEARASLNLELADARAEDVAIEVAAVESAEADLRKTEVDLANAEANLENKQKSVEQEIIIAEIDLDNAELALKKTEASVASQTTKDDTAVANAISSYYSDAGRIVNSIVSVFELLDIIYGFEGEPAAIKGTEISGEEADIYRDLRSLYSENLREIENIQDAIETASETPTIDEALELERNVDATVDDLSFMVILLGDLLTKVGGIPELPFSEYSSAAASFDAAVAAYNVGKTAFDNAVLEQFENLEVDPLDVETAQLDVERLTAKLEQVKVEGDIALEQAENEVKRIEAQVDVMKSAVSRAEASLDKVLADPREVDLGPFRARIEQAAARLSSAQADLNDTILTAPIDGVITNREVDFGELVTAGGAAGRVIALEMIDNSEFHIDVSVPETQISKINEESKIEISFDAFGPAEVFDGRIVSIEPSATEVDGIVYYIVKVAQTEEDPRLKAGMTADVTIFADPKENVLAVPEVAVFRDDGRKWILLPGVTADAEPERTLVRTGVRGLNGMIEVTEGLEEGQQVLVPKS